MTGLMRKEEITMMKIVDTKNLDDFIKEYDFKKMHREGVKVKNKSIP